MVRSDSIEFSEGTDVRARGKCPAFQFDTVSQCMQSAFSGGRSQIHHQATGQDKVTTTAHNFSASLSTPSIIPLYLPITKLQRCWRPEACTAMLLETLISSTALTLLVESRVTERSRTHRKLRHLSSVAASVEDRRNRTCIRSDDPCQQLRMGSKLSSKSTDGHGHFEIELHA